MHHPARQGQGRHRDRGDLARSVDRDHDLWPRRHRRDGDVGARHRAVGCGGQARRPAAAPAVGPLSLGNPDLRLRLLPRRRRRRHDREGAALRQTGLQGDQDAGRACAHAGAGPRQCAPHARGARARHRHHDRRQHGLERRCRDRDGTQVREVRHLLARGAGAGRRFCRLSAHRGRARHARRRRRDPFHALRSAAVLPSIPACRSCSPTRCAAA